MKPIDRLDPEVAKAIELIPFSEMNAETAAMINSLTFEIPLSDAVERTDHVVAGDPEVPVRVHRPKGVVGPAAVHVLDARWRLRRRRLLDG